MHILNSVGFLNSWVMIMFIGFWRNWHFQTIWLRIWMTYHDPWCWYFHKNQFEIQTSLIFSYLSKIPYWTANAVSWFYIHRPSTHNHTSNSLPMEGTSEKECTIRSTHVFSTYPCPGLTCALKHMPLQHSFPLMYYSILYSFSSSYMKKH